MAANVSICIVDDSTDYCSLLAFIAKRYLPDYSISFYANGRIFLDTLASMPKLPRLIILDRHMPTLNGYQTLLALKQQPAYRTIPIVMMSTEASPEEVSLYYQAGGNSFLVKPMDIDALAEMMRSVCTYWLEINRNPVTVN